ncbi:MAG: sodium/proline symporter [Anaerovoracaceae bacterium]|nr:sodium/proline symporter [Bacillota bacterium]MDY2670528.1 sodium/proline symporter [Anaerovoracaceae bacterium]
MSSSTIFMTISIVVYLIMMVLIGLWSSKKNKNTDDFYLGGRQLGPLVTAMSAEASDMSSWLLMGIPGLAYLSGVASNFWTILGLGIGTYLNWLFVAKRIRTYTEISHNSITIPQFFSNRFRDNRRILTAIAAVIIVIFFIPYTASGFAACGKLFNSLFGVDYLPAMIVSALVIIAYTALGGFLAASTTDLVQSIIMTIAIVAVLFYGVHAAGGVEQVIINADSLKGYLSLTQSHVAETGGVEDISVIWIISQIAWGLGYCGMPHILLRFMAINDKRKLKISRRIATVWVFISMAVALGIGIAGRAVTAEGKIPFLKGSSSETIIVKFADLIAEHGFGAALFAGLIIAGILAATMSTADSQLLAASSSVSQNLIREVFGFKVSARTEMIIARISLLVIAVIGMFLAKDPDSSVFTIVSFAWAGFGAAFGPVVLCALFWRRANKWGALAGMVFGGAMVFIWKFLVRPLGGGWDIYELLPAFLVALAMIIIVSLVTGEPEKEVTDEFDQYKEAMARE